MVSAAAACFATLISRSELFGVSEKSRLNNTFPPCFIAFVAFARGKTRNVNKAKSMILMFTFNYDTKFHSIASSVSVRILEEKKEIQRIFRRDSDFFFRFFSFRLKWKRRQQRLCIKMFVPIRDFAFDHYCSFRLFFSSNICPKDKLKLQIFLSEIGEKKTQSKWMNVRRSFVCKHNVQKILILNLWTLNYLMVSR